MEALKDKSSVLTTISLIISVFLTTVLTGCKFSLKDRIMKKMMGNPEKFIVHSSTYDNIFQEREFAEGLEEEYTGDFADQEIWGQLRLNF